MKEKKEWMNKWKDEWMIKWGLVFSEDKKRVWFREARSQCEHILKNFNCLTREWAKWVSEVSERARERSEQVKWANVGSDQGPVKKAIVSD